MPHHHASSSETRRYRGVRRRSSGKWVSEIREPKTPKRIWLGTFPTPEMAAIAYDVASRALKGENAELNFPDSIASFPVPASNSPRDIQAAAACSAAAYGAAKDALSLAEGNLVKEDVVVLENNAMRPSLQHNDMFVDDDLIFDFPNVLVNMAEGMLIEPPRLVDVPFDNPHSAEDYDNLWK